MKHGALNAEETLHLLIEFAYRALEDIEQQERAGELTDYQRGLKSVHVEYLEKIQESWEKAIEAGIDWDIEENFPV